jgi:hypothetical protein
MWRGVAKCGSPAPKSTSFAPSARSFAAAAVTAMVAEISMRPMRWLNFVAVDGGALERVAEALMLSSLQGVREVVSHFLSAATGRMSGVASRLFWI